MGVVVSTLLLFLPEEETFWTMTALIEDILPGESHACLIRPRSLTNKAATLFIMKKITSWPLHSGNVWVNVVVRHFEAKPASIVLEWANLLFSDFVALLAKNYMFQPRMSEPLFQPI